MSGTQNLIEQTEKFLEGIPNWTWSGTLVASCLKPSKFVALALALPESASFERSTSSCTSVGVEEGLNLATEQGLD
uniref:Uncharacterized protein n=1 Tax=Nelumbo nucifera TaxID=4432 RepID=A0A822Y1B2_NELNU|nr:TPA_asm: hypothetical protein HUJ06_027715 [Nelumbo nucifera]